MTIDEAIKNNDEHAKAHHNDAYRDYYVALQLGNEALIFYQTHKSRVIPPYDVLLPGETK